MLARHLRPTGYDVQVSTTRAMPGDVEARVEREGPGAVFIAVVPPGGLAQARYLCRRLRRRFPDLRIVVGYWGRTRDFDQLLVRLRASGASYVTTSLLQTASQIRAIVPAPQPETTDQPAAPVAVGGEMATGVATPLPNG
jgi:hypothetical protein